MCDTLQYCLIYAIIKQLQFMQKPVNKIIPQTLPSASGSAESSPKPTKQYLQQIQKEAISPDIPIINFSKPEYKSKKQDLQDLKPQQQKKQIEKIKNSENVSQPQTLKEQLNKPENQVIQVEVPQKIKPILNITQLIKLLQQRKPKIVWIYVVSTPIPEKDRIRIAEVYRRFYTANNNENMGDIIEPYFQTAELIQSFLQLAQSKLKIVTNIRNANAVFQLQNQQKYNQNNVEEYYIYNDQGEQGTNQAQQYQSQIPKIKGIYSSKYLGRLIDQTVQDMGYQIEPSVTPSFLKLSGEDKTRATRYRANLYGALKIHPSQLEPAYKDFINYFEQSQSHRGKTLGNYSSFKHTQLVQTKQQAQQIIRCYTEQNAFYKILNQMLRGERTVKEFKPCVLPFNQTYRSIKYFYQEYVKEMKRKLPQMRFYRGTKLNTEDLNVLKPGKFIEMFGFMSTSESLHIAQNFARWSGSKYIIQISVKAKQISPERDIYDHGFMDLQKYDSTVHRGEREFLFNALNIYKVTKIQEKEYKIIETQKTQNYTHICLQYGAIFDLLQKPKNTLTAEQAEILINYQFCTQLMDDSKDLGDVHLMVNELDQAQTYYKSIIKLKMQDLQKKKENMVNSLGSNHEKTKLQYKKTRVQLAEIYSKLANVQILNGHIEEAEKNTAQCQYIMKEEASKNIQISEKVIKMYTNSAEIKTKQEDFISAEKDLSQIIQMEDTRDAKLIFRKAQAMRMRGLIRYKKGELITAKQDLKNSEELLLRLDKIAEEDREEIQNKYRFSFLTLWCSSDTMETIQARKTTEIESIKAFQSQVSAMKYDIMKKKIKVIQCLKEIAQNVKDRQQQQNYVRKGNDIRQEAKRQTNNTQQATEVKIMLASLQYHQNIAKSEKVFKDAIQEFEANDPFNPLIAQYRTMLAQCQKKEIQQIISLEEIFLQQKSEPYNQQQVNQRAQENKQNYRKAILLQEMHHSKNSPEVVTLKNQLGELEYITSKYAACQTILRQVKATQLKHTQMSKATLLLAKVAFARGQLKKAFKYLQEAQVKLKKVLVKRQNDAAYIAVYQNNDIYLQILLTKAKVFNKQTNHDASLRSLQTLEMRILDKMKGYEIHTLLAQVYEQMAVVQASKATKSSGNYGEYYQKAIKLREKQIGRLNIYNAINYCNYSNYLVMINKNFQRAGKNLQLAQNIFSRLDKSHPINWTINFALGLYYGLYYKEKKELAQARMFLERSLELATAKFDSSHLTIKRVKYRVALMEKTLNPKRSYQLLAQLKRTLNIELQRSALTFNIAEGKDDEKIDLLKTVCNEMILLLQKSKGELQLPDAKRTYQALKRQKQELVKRYNLQK